MNIIKLKVQNFEITPLEKQYVVENQVNEFALEFEFDDSWDYETKYVVFDNEETTYKRPIIDNRVIIPSELLNGRTTIQIYGQNVENGEIVKRKPSYKYSFSILNSLSTEGQEESELPTPSQWEVYIQQIQDLCNDLQDQFDDLKEECETKCDDVIERLEKDEQDIQTNTDNIRANAENIDKLNTDLLDYSLITETGNKISMSINPNTYVITLSLKDKNDNVLSTQSVDLPLETMIVSASYSNGILTFTLKNGQTLQVPIGDLISGLVSTDTFNQTVQGLSDRITTIENDYLKSTDKTELQESITGLRNEIELEQQAQDNNILSLQNENERLSRIVEGLPTKQANGTSFVLNDTIKANIKDYQLRGNTTQKTTTGKNLFKPYSYSRTASSVTFTTENGYIQANGTASADAYSILSSDAQNVLIELQPGNYCISGATSSLRLEVVRSNGQMIVSTTGNDLYAPFTLQETTNVFVRAKVLNGTSINNVKIYPQLEIGLTPTSYEEYTGGVPSPNPSYPQTINVVTGNQEINVYGKNLYDDNKEVDSYYYDNNGNQQSGGTQQYINQEYNISNKSIVISFNSKVGNAYVRVVEFNNNAFIKRSLLNTNGGTLTLDNNTNRVIFCVDKTDNQYSTDYFNKLQIEFGDTPTSYEKYQTLQTKPISLGNIELCKIGDYQDKIYKSNDKWYLEKNIGKVVLNGSEDNFGYGAILENTIRIRYSTKQNAKTNQQLCNRLIYKTMYNTDEEGFYVSTISNDLYIRLNKSLAGETKETIKTYMQQNNTIVYYILETPVITEITDSTLISQLEDILNIILNENNTIIVNGNLPSDTLVIGYADIAKLIASLSSQDNRSVDTKKGGETEPIEEPIETKEEER